VSTHLDGYNEETGELTEDAEREMYNWAMAKFPGYAEQHGPFDEFKDKDDPDYQAFQEWAVGEWQAANDNRLTNPYDKMLYDLNTSTELSDESKAFIKNVLTSPEALSAISGIEVDKKTGKIVVKTKDKSLMKAVDTDTDIEPSVKVIKKPKPEPEPKKLPLTPRDLATKKPEPKKLPLTPRDLVDTDTDIEPSI
jgi:hypothetical protein